MVPLIRSFIVLGARDGAGLTSVTSSILRALRRAGVRAVGMKPIARGVVMPGGRWHSDDLERLSAAGAFGLPARALCSRLLAPDEEMPVRAGEPPTLEAVIDTFRVLSTWADAVVIDGAAGASFSGLDLARALAVPFVFVVGGDPAAFEPSIDEANALVAAGLECAGWVIANARADAGEGEEVLQALRARMPGEWLSALPQSVHIEADAALATLDVGRALKALAA